MGCAIGPRGKELLATWGKVAATYPSGPGYDLTRPTRSDRYRTRLQTFIDTPSESNFERLWQTDAVAAASEWYPATVLNLGPDSLDELALFFDEIRVADEYDEKWAKRARWGWTVPELYSRANPELPIVSGQARRGLRKFSIEPATDFHTLSDQLAAFQDVYLDVAGHVTPSRNDSIPIYAEIDQLFALVTTVTDEEIQAEQAGYRRGLYSALRGYPGSAAEDRGPIEIDFDAATPAVDGHIGARKARAYRDTETTHWAGSHYEWWKWDFAEYVADEVATTYTLNELSPDELAPFFDAFWTNADAYTDTDILSTPVPQYLLGRWGVVQLEDFKSHCLDNPEEAATVLSTLFDEDEHLVDRLHQFHTFADIEEVSDGNLLRIASTLLMGAYPDEYVNFQYERFDTFFSDCSNLESITTGFDARQYYRITLACRDLRDGMQDELPEASMLDVHTLIRLYQDFVNK